MQPSLSTEANECRNGNGIPEIVHTRIDGFNDKYGIPNDPLRIHVSDVILTVNFFFYFWSRKGSAKCHVAMTEEGPHVIHLNDSRNSSIPVFEFTSFCISRYEMMTSRQ